LISSQYVIHYNPANISLTNKSDIFVCLSWLLRNIHRQVWKQQYVFLNV